MLFLANYNVRADLFHGYSDVFTKDGYFVPRADDLEGYSKFKGKPS